MKIYPVSSNAKKLEDRYVMIQLKNKEGETYEKFVKFDNKEFKKLDNKIYQVRKNEKSGQEYLIETFGFVDVVVYEDTNKDGKAFTKIIRNDGGWTAETILAAQQIVKAIFKKQ